MTGVPADRRWPGRAVLIGTAVVGVWLVALLARYPANLRDPGDIVTASIAHLVINLVLGLAGAGIGVLIGRLAQPAVSTRHVVAGASVASSTVASSTVVGDTVAGDTPPEPAP